MHLQWKILENNEIKEQNDAVTAVTANDIYDTRVWYSSKGLDRVWLNFTLAGFSLC